MKGHPPIPLKVIDLNVTSEFILIVDDCLGTAKSNCKKKKKALVVRVDEYNTSKCCSNRYIVLDNVIVDDEPKCYHK